MAVGPGFNSPETQAAIQAQQEAAAKQAEEAGVETPEVDPAAQAPAENAEEAAASNPPETPPAEGPGTEESAESDNTDINMENVEVQSQEEIDKALADAGFSNDDLGKELAENEGKLTEETVKALKEKFPPEAVDNAVKDMEKQFADEAAGIDKDVAARKADIDSMNNYIFSELAGGDAVKGKENFNVLSAWAQENMDQGELEAINTLLRSGNKVVVKRGLEMAVSQWKKGKESKMMSGDSAAAANNTEERFEPLSKDKFIQIMTTKKYQEDTEYAAKIDARRRKTMETEGAITPEFSHLRPPI